MKLFFYALLEKEKLPLLEDEHMFVYDEKEVNLLTSQMR